MPTANRFLGNAQGLTGSCHSEAMVGALEYAFAARGMSVELSTYFAHADSSSGTTDDDTRQTYSAADAPIFSALGLLVAYYMLPEDRRGIDASSVGYRSAGGQMIVDGGFPGHGAFGFREDSFTFEPGWANTKRDFNEFKLWITQRLPVTISVDGALLDYFVDKNTGLLNQPYTPQAVWAKVVESNDKVEKQRTRHGVALVGFDDSLYAYQHFAVGPGAFIIRNSWNENRDVGLLLDKIDLNQFPAQALLRAKISPTINEPGYYAIPYQYFVDLMNRNLPGNPRIGDGNVFLYSINYDAFMSAYTQQAGRYEVLEAPFACNWSRAQVMSRMELGRESLLFQPTRRSNICFPLAKSSFSE